MSFPFSLGSIPKLTQEDESFKIQKVIESKTLCVQTCAGVYVCMNVYVCTCVYMYMCECVFVCTCVCVCSVSIVLPGDNLSLNLELG